MAELALPTRRLNDRAGRQGRPNALLLVPVKQNPEGALNDRFIARLQATR